MTKKPGGTITKLKDGDKAKPNTKGTHVPGKKGGVD